MKCSLLLLFVLCSSSTSFADDYLPRKKLGTEINIEGVRGGYTSVSDDGVDPNPGDVAYTIKDPVVRHNDDMYFLRGSSGHGLCSYLGYEKYVRKSMRFKNVSSGGVLVIERSESFSYYSDLYRYRHIGEVVKEITCLNRMPDRPHNIVTKFKMPIYFPSTQIPILADSDSDGVCNLLKHGTHIIGSLWPWYGYPPKYGRQTGWIIDRQGNVDHEKVDHTIKEIVCTKVP